MATVLLLVLLVLALQSRLALGIIRTIDVSSLLAITPNESAFVNASREIDLALSEDGLFLAVGHGITAEQRASTLGAAKALFDLPEDVKSLHRLTRHRGFIPFAGESGLTDTVFEPKEGFSYGLNWSGMGPPPSVMHAPNTFPPELADAEVEKLDSLRAACARLAEALSRAIRSLPGIDDALAGAKEGGEEISLMRVFHYFPLSDDLTRKALLSNGDKEVLGSSPHTDWGYWTVILEDGDGLQFWKSGQWHNVPHAPEAVIINAGDFLSLSTGLRFHSPIHRVLSPKEKHRLSFVYFHYPGASSVLPATQSGETDVGVEGENHNTLLGTKGGTEEESFAELIQRKWQGVYKL